MVFFLILFLSLIVTFIFSLCVKDKKTKKILGIIMLIVLCFVSGTRYNTGGTDYFVYKKSYEYLNKSISILENINRYNPYSMEAGFIAYMTIIKKMGLNFYGFTLVNATIFYLIFYKVLKKYEYNMNFILIFFMYKMFFYNTFISMRQPIAILLFWLSLPYLRDKKYVKYYLICGLAMLFHKSSILLFFVPLITNFKLSKNKFLTILIICLPFYFIHISNFSFITNMLKIIFSSDNTMIEKIDSYSISIGGMSIFYLLEYYLIAIIIYINYDSIYKYDDNSKFFVKLFTCLVPFYTIFANIPIVTRFKDFFFLTYPIMITYIAKIQKRYASIIYIFSIIVCLYGYVRYLKNFDGGELLNYMSYLFKKISILN